MKKICLFLSFVLVVGILLFLSCKKEYSCENCQGINKLPIANAGPDQVIALPTDSVLLDGSASTDPDGMISSWLWTKISGPASFNISNATTTKVIVKNLTIGVYQFELKITDNKNLSAKDTIQITVKDPSQPNRPPVANAGPDQTINLPTTTINLNGNGSTDPDNNIVSYQWTKISGSASFNIVNPNAVQSQLTNLDLGVYNFALKVTDAGGLFSRDTMQVTVLPEAILCNLRLTPIGMLSEARYGIVTATAGNKILFAGGNPYSSGSGSRVDIYNMVSQTWSAAELSVPRVSLSAATVGNKIFFAGGESETSRIDIYDAGNDTWSTDELLEPRSGIAVAGINDKIFFAGGLNSNGCSDAVEIYDVSTNSWSYARLSRARQLISAIAYGTKIYFAGGENDQGSPSDIVDIYDAISDSWTTTTMTEPKLKQLSIAAAGKVFWAGGINGGTNCSLKVEMYDVNTGVPSFHQFSQTSCYPKAGIANNKIVFFTQEGGIKVEVFDITTQSWSFCNLSYNSLKEVANANNNIYCVMISDVNGEIVCQVWKLEF